MFNVCVLHDDYEDFAQKYLGIDYEDYIHLEKSLPDEDELYLDLEYEIEQIMSV